MTFTFGSRLDFESMEQHLMRAKDTRFSTLRLNFETEASWAVIGMPSGAIALDEAGRLIIKLSREEAIKIAADRSISERPATSLGTSLIGSAQANFRL